ncbi:MAG: hypothetical protein ACUVTX_03175, partial [Bacteroidales bacterium]
YLAVKAMHVKKFFFVFLIFALFQYTLAQDAKETQDTLRKDALNVYMEASDFIKREIPFINYVRDLKDADVYIISTYQATGAGGIEYTYFITGQRKFAGMNDTVLFSSSPDDTQDIIRIKQVNTLKMGLMRYIQKTPLARYINISFSIPLSESVSTDKWNNWVFRSSLSGYLTGEKSYQSKYIRGSISANRVTSDWKINMNASYYYSVSTYDISGIKYTSDYNTKNFYTLIVKSLSDHWSAGGSFSTGSSTYANRKFNASLMPGIEYDIYPYSQSTRKQLRLLYQIGFNPVIYYDTTIYNKTRENLWQHSVKAAYEVVQKWGSIDLNLSYSNYLHDWSKNNLSVYSYINMRITKGLSFNIGGGASLIHDQLGLEKGGATTEEILLRRKQLETQYEYYISFGLTYTFGSIYSNVVNPRFGGGSSGGMYIIMN